MQRLAAGAPTREVALNVLWHGPISRADIARRTGLTSGAVTKITRSLIKDGIIREGEPVAAELGRPSLPLTIVDEWACCLGFKLVPGRAFVVCMGLAGVVKERHEFELDTSTFASAADALEAWIDGRHCSAVGVALPASVAASGELHATRMLGWEPGSNLERELETRLGIPCTSSNDVHGLAIHAQWFGSLHSVQDGVVITFGKGIGVAVINDGQLLLGHQGAAAVLGRLPAPGGGLFEEVLSQDALAAEASKLVGRAVSFEEALLDPASQPAVDRVVEALAALTRVAVVSFAPQKVLLTGEGIGVLRGDLEPIRAEVAREWRDDLDSPEFVLEPLDFEQFAIGAAALAVRELFEKRA